MTKNYTNLNTEGRINTKKKKLDEKPRGTKGKRDRKSQKKKKNE